MSSASVASGPSASAIIRILLNALTLAKSSSPATSSTSSSMGDGSAPPEHTRGSGTRRRQNTQHICYMSSCPHEVASQGAGTYSYWRRGDPQCRNPPRITCEGAQEPYRTGVRITLTSRCGLPWRTGRRRRGRRTSLPSLSARTSHS